MKHITLTQSDRFQLFTLRMGLRTAVQSEGRMHLTNPVLVRRCANHWLTLVGFKVTNRTRWATLLEMFESTIGKAMDEADKASGNEPDPSLN
jgi:hypothetical protein